MKLIFLVISLLLAVGYVGAAPRPQDYNIYRTGSFYPSYVYNHPSVSSHSYPISSAQSADASIPKSLNLSSNVNTNSFKDNQDNVDVNYSSLFSSDSSSKNGNVSPSESSNYDDNNNNNNNNNNSDVNYSFGIFGSSQNWKNSAPVTGFGFPFAPNGGSFGDFLDHVTDSSLNSAASPLNYPLFNAAPFIAITRVAASAQSLNEPKKPEEMLKIKVIGDTSGTINIINPFITGKSNGVNCNNESRDARPDSNNNTPDDDFLKRISPFRTGVDPVFGPEIAPKYEIHYTPENWNSDVVPPLLPFHPDLFAGPGYVLLHNASMPSVPESTTLSSISFESTPDLQSHSPKIEMNEESSSEFPGAPASIDSLFKSKDESNTHSETSSHSSINSTNSTDEFLSDTAPRDRKSSTLNRKKKSSQVRRDKTKPAIDSKKFKKSSVSFNSEIRSAVPNVQKSSRSGNDVKKFQTKPESIRKQRM